MTKLSLFLAQTQPAAPAAPSWMQLGGQMLPLILMFAAMYFLLIAPQRKKQKEHEKMLTALKSGDEIVTTGGIYGTITSVKEDRFVVRVGDGQKLEIGKGFVHALVKKTDAS
jgi:preprotein translocase subunit YajC